MCFVEPALKPFREIADGCIPVSRRCENMQMIRHRNRRENSPLIQLVEHSATCFPRSDISEHRFASLDAKRNEINRTLFPRQPIWNAWWSAHDCQFIRSPSHRDGLQRIRNRSLPANLAAFVLFFQPAHQRLEIIHHCAGRDVLASGLPQDFTPVFSSTFLRIFDA